jgi:hypothetical protein
MPLWWRKLFQAIQRNRAILNTKQEFVEIWIKTRILKQNTWHSQHFMCTSAFCTSRMKMTRTCDNIKKSELNYTTYSTIIPL